MRTPFALPVRRKPVRRGSGAVLLELDLTRQLHEAPPASPLEAVRAAHAPTLRVLVEALAKAARDDRVVGLVGHVGHRQPTLAQSEELRRAVQAFARTGRPTVCWSESYGEMGPGNVAYHLASAFEEVWLQPSGDVGLVGVHAQAAFLRGTFDKLGVETQVGQRAEYKTAANTFTETSMTEPHREMLTRLVESSMETVLRDVAEARGLPVDRVRELVDEAPLSADDALRHGLVDRLGYRDEVYASLRDRLGEDVGTKLVERFGKGRLDALAQLGGAAAHRHRPVVAVVSAVGGIHLGRSSSSPLSGRSVGSDSLGAALRAAARDEQVKAVVLRVDSPGGSYVASDAIRREVLALRRSGTPVVASMASVAGSGGYYVAMPADEVLASAGTLTGSIGVFAGKQVIREALAKVGVNREGVHVGRYADMFSTDRPFSAEEWARLEQWLDRVYDDFTAKAADDRGMPVEALREVARGRVWTGADALDRGLVDRIGGLEDAVEVACERAGVARSEVDVRGFPKVHPLERLMPPESTDSPAAARLGEGMPLLDAALGAMRLPAYGVLTMPWQVTLR